mmetsp:Transcript_52600/g.163230  ORF Transcript_52600/g.163230 Transcript_52600/m.163230 type:complete len:104 (-) Transcript_52600:490-801(-)
MSPRSHHHSLQANPAHSQKIKTVCSLKARSQSPPYGPTLTVTSILHRASCSLSGSSRNESKTGPVKAGHEPFFRERSLLKNLKRGFEIAQNAVIPLKDSSWLR